MNLLIVFTYELKKEIYSKCASWVHGTCLKSSCYVQKLNVNVKENDMKGLATM